jgi:hypothetical protein
MITIRDLTITFQINTEMTLRTCFQIQSCQYASSLANIIGIHELDKLSPQVQTINRTQEF